MTPKSIIIAIQNAIRQLQWEWAHEKGLLKDSLGRPIIKR